jgi:TBC1 domain family protein 5
MLKSSLLKLKNLIQPEKDKSIIDQENLDSSFANFTLHYSDPRKALLKDIDSIKKCKLSNTERSFTWLFFLDILPFKNPSTWKKILSIEREKYSQLRNKYITTEIESFIELKGLNDTIKYDNYKSIISEKEFELLNLIKIDVLRTFQEDEIFKLDIVKKKLVTVLYIYAKENAELGYQQGMGDICGVFLYVLYKEFYLKSGFEKDEMTSIYSLIHSNNVYLEYDLYLIFDKFMRKGIAEFFLYNTSKYKENILGSKSIEEKLNLTLEDIQKCEDCELKKRTYILFYIYFKQIDPAFFDSIKNYVYPEIFMLRWYLCAFTREFQLSQVVLIWDLIIMYEYVENHLLKKEQIKTHLNFIEGVSLSMMIHFKPNIMQKEDKNDIMIGIMHYPTDISIEKICKKAIEIYLKLNPNITV